MGTLTTWGYTLAVVALPVARTVRVIRTGFGGTGTNTRRKVLVVPAGVAGGTTVGIAVEDAATIGDALSVCGGVSAYHNGEADEGTRTGGMVSRGTALGDTGTKLTFKVGRAVPVVGADGRGTGANARRGIAGVEALIPGVAPVGGTSEDAATVGDALSVCRGFSTYYNWEANKRTRAGGVVSESTALGHALSVCIAHPAWGALVVVVAGGGHTQPKLAYMATGALAGVRTAVWHALSVCITGPALGTVFAVRTHFRHTHPHLTYPTVGALAGVRTHRG